MRGGCIINEQGVRAFRSLTFFCRVGGSSPPPTPPLGYFYRNDGRVAQLKNKGGFCVVLLGVLMDF